ncbi:MAG: hypothetical protein IKA85_07380 [Clostridia bacterium]|nr:hypothetical protein [Clostridia bacterium]
MKIQRYIDIVTKNKKAPFCKITINKNFEWRNLNKLCDLTLTKETLNIAWSLIIDTILDTYKNKEYNLFIPKDVLDFLIDNKICLIDLAHMKLSEEYLSKIVKQDSSCWEALKTIETYKNDNN